MRFGVMRDAGRDRLPELELTFASYASQEAHDHTGYCIPRKGAQCFEAVGLYAPALAGQLAALRWLREEMGWDWIFTRCWCRAYRSATPDPFHLLHPALCPRCASLNNTEEELDSLACAIGEIRRG